VGVSSRAEQKETKGFYTNSVVEKGGREEKVTDEDGFVFAGDRHTHPTSIAEVTDRLRGAVDRPSQAGSQAKRARQASPVGSLWGVTLSGVAKRTILDESQADGAKI